MDAFGSFGSSSIGCLPLRIPTVGGRELDLHKLFVEVTSRGGIEKVIRERKWKEITVSFKFPNTATNASFVLRKYYLSLLNHYEKLYFFKSEGWNAPLPALSAEVLTPVHIQVSAEPPLPSRDTQTVGRKRRSITEQLKNGVNSRVSGVIDGKTQDGYLVSVRVGTNVFRGIVYHVDEKSATSSFLAADSTKHPVPGGRRKRRRKLSKLDPNHPKPNRSGYNFFFAEQHAKLKLIHSGKDREISKMIGELWNKLTENEKAVYQEIGVRDRERYRREMAIYRERQRGGGPIISNAVPIQQIPGGTSLPVANEDQKTEDDNQRSSNGSDIGGSTESDSYMEECPEAEIDADPAHLLDELMHETPATKVVDSDKMETEACAAGAAGPSNQPEVEKT